MSQRSLRGSSVARCYLTETILWALSTVGNQTSWVTWTYTVRLSSTCLPKAFPMYRLISSKLARKPLINRPLNVYWAWLNFWSQFCQHSLKHCKWSKHCSNKSWTQSETYGRLTRVTCSCRQRTLWCELNSRQPRAQPDSNKLRLISRTPKRKQSISKSNLGKHRKRSTNLNMEHRTAWHRTWLTQLTRCQQWSLDGFFKTCQT